MKKIQATVYLRRSQEGYYSIERVFDAVCGAFPGSVTPRISTCRFSSQGVWRRVANMVEAMFRQGDVNHITGDVHFLTYLLRRHKTILTIHDLVSVQRSHGVRKALFLFFWYWLPVKRSAIVTVISEATRDELVRHLRIDPEKIRVVPDCISPSFRASPKVFCQDRPLVLQVGVGANKNLDRVAAALQGIPCRLRIIGRPKQQHIQILRSNGIDFSCAADLTDEQVVEEYQQCDMLVFASTYEGFGLPIVEAQATGRPVVTSGISPMREVSGEFASLVDPLDVECIRKGILRVIRDPEFRDGIIDGGYRNAERFCAHQVAREYEELYKELCSR
jgi:glycosyltransferase involved in cell wall biosynthesis